MNTQTNTLDSKIIDIDSSILSPYLEECRPETIHAWLQAFIKQQLATWPELKQAINKLDEQLINKIFLTESEVILQHNPRRLKSSASKVDKKSIKQRPSFRSRKGPAVFRKGFQDTESKVFVRLIFYQPLMPSFLACGGCAEA